MQKWQDIVNGINKSAGADLSEDEAQAINALVSFFNGGNFQASESGGYIRVIKTALPQHAKNRLLKVHLTNFVAMCEKYFKAQTVTVVGQQVRTTTIGAEPIVVSQPQIIQPQEEKKFYYLEDNAQKGPAGISQLKAAGITPDTLVWTEGYENWKPANDVEELKTLFMRTPPAQIPAQRTNVKPSPKPKVPMSGLKKALVAIVLVLAALGGGYYKLKDSVFLAGIMDSMGPIDYSLIPVVREHGQKFGYINNKGEFVISPQFDEADFFIDGLARVVYNGKYGYINKKGEYVIAPTYNSATAFGSGLAFVVAEGERITCIDKNGDTQFVLNEIDNVAPFTEGLALFGTEDNKLGYINTSGEIVINTQFELAYPFRGGFARIIQDGKTGFIDKTGRITINPQFMDAKDFSEGLAPVYDGNLWGYINTSGSYVINPRFHDASSFSSGLAAVTHEDSFGYIDKKGISVINTRLRRGFDFLSGIAPILEESAMGKFGFINKTGEYVISPQFDFIIYEPAITYHNRSADIFAYDEFYDASEFISLFFAKESGNTFDGISASTTLEQLSNHPVYGHGVNAISGDNVEFDQMIPIARNIYIRRTLFRFFNTNVYAYDNWGGRTGFNFSATPDAIMYLLNMGGKANKNVVLNALKTEIERRQGQTMSVEENYLGEGYKLSQDGGKLSFVILKRDGSINERDGSIVLIVAFNKEVLDFNF